MTRLLEEISLNAWPAIESQPHDGWILRYTRGYTRRANSVQALDAGVLPLEKKIDHCEGEYRAKGLRCVFKMTEASQPPELDSVLQSRGYHKEAPTSVQTLDLTALRPESSRRVQHWPQAQSRWLDAYAQLNSVSDQNRSTLSAIVGAITQPLCCAMLLDDGQNPLSCGLAVIERQWVGLFDIVTRHDRRGQGLASETIAHLLAWAKENGATKSYLQVMLNNAPALALYKKLGFAPAYQYWYRVKN